MLMSALYWMFILLAHWNNSPWVDMSLHSDILFWFQAIQSLLLFLSGAFLTKKATNTHPNRKENIKSKWRQELAIYYILVIYCNTVCECKSKKMDVTNELKSPYLMKVKVNRWWQDLLSSFAIIFPIIFNVILHLWKINRSCVEFVDFIILVPFNWMLFSPCCEAQTCIQNIRSYFSFPY